ncbi:MAG: DUF1080 domain-containing protein [Gemmataceae bacterium]
MKPACFFIYLALLSPAALHAGEAKPNTLSPKEIADGWILLFDGETTFGLLGDGWKVEAGELVSPGKDATLRPTCRFQDFRLHFEYRLEADKTGSLSFGSPSDEGKSDSMRPLRFYRHGEGWHSFIGNTSGSQFGGSIECPDKKILFPTAAKRGDPMQPHALVFQGESLRLRNVKLQPLKSDRKRPDPIFNGKDLTGWKEFPGKKSKFAVVDGAINVKDGPGDLQTAGKYRDFILQLECKSNGKHLNSGIFFRCRDNEYQNGYEAQIRNQFTPKPTQKYLIEDYDPRTNKLLGKREVFYAAVDYGTGAIYRRQPARKEMSRDGEWFGMTIVARGAHFATWVNGIQVTDWTDNRPRSDNARTGRKLEAGHISIQGHDPTTDLSFRNLRIAEFPTEPHK